jgi:hypothetical protein
MKRRNDRSSRTSRRRMAHPPETAFLHGTSLLNNTNVDFLWKVSARLSLHEAFTEPEDPCFLLPMLSTENIRLFDQIIIASRADSSKSRHLIDEELRAVLNDCVDSSNNTDSLARLKVANHTDRSHLELQRFLSQMANVQFPLQEARPVLQTGRAIAIFESLPRSHAELIPSDRRSEVELLLGKMNNFLGVSLSDIARSFLVVLSYQALAHVASRQAVEMFLAGEPRPSSNDRLRNATISALLTYSPADSLDRWLLFDPERLAAFFDLKSASESLLSLDAFLRLFSATADQLRAALKTRKEFSIGHISSRLSPLERYPVVRMKPGGSKLIVPNYWHLAKSFGPVVDFSLLEAFQDDYSRARGTLLELYLRRLLGEQLPDLIVIPETSYGRPERRGPDLTLIDPRHERIILVEIKGRRMTLDTRLTMDSDTFNANLKESYGALLSLPQKLQDLYSGIPEYRQYQAAIDSTRNSEPILAVVLSEGVYFMSHIVRLQAQEPADRLYDFKYPYCVLSLDRFEHAVEVSKSHQQPLWSLFEQHYQRSGALDHQSPAADMFGGATIDEDETFAARFAPPEPKLIT